MIFITGGTGFLGRYLVPVLCNTGHSLVILTRNSRSHTWLSNYPNIKIVEGDIAEPDTYSRWLLRCDSIIHAAGMFRFWGSQAEFYRTNVDGTKAVLKTATKGHIERFIHISTVAVIGHPERNSIIDEVYPPLPLDAYQKTKFEAEQLALKYHKSNELPVVVLRPGAFYGPLGHYGFNRLFFRDPMRGIIMQVDRGENIIFPVFIGDVANGIINALRLAQVGEIYNICGDSISHREAFDIVCDIANITYPRIPMPGRLALPLGYIMEQGFSLFDIEPIWPVNLLRSYVLNNWRVSSEKARTKLGFSPTSFIDGARKTIDWYKAGQPNELRP